MVPVSGVEVIESLTDTNIPYIRLSLNLWAVAGVAYLGCGVEECPASA